jgi:hypothetical protein
MAMLIAPSGLWMIEMMLWPLEVQMVRAAGSVADSVSALACLSM